MENKLMIFKNEDLGEIRSLEINNEPWFVAKDVCDILDIKNSRQALTRLEDDEKSDVILNDGSQNRNLSTVNEYGLYNLILASRKKEAKAFKRWVTHEVLPAIRKTGKYISKKKHKPIDRVLKQHMNIAERLSQITGVKPQMAYAIAINEASKETGYSYEEYRKLLPSVDYKIGDLNATEVGKRLGLKAHEANIRLSELGLQEKRDKKWRLTNKGKHYGEEKAFTRNGHSDYQIAWTEKVFELFN